jgi:hypothetical protein
VAICLSSVSEDESMPRVYLRHCGTQFSTLSQKMPFPAMQADVAYKGRCRTYYVVGLGPKSVE